jgi:hypothetical protein
MEENQYNMGETIPDIPGTFGVWFPSSPCCKTLVVNPVKAMEGVGPDGGMKADFDQVENDSKGV